jgi:hypothetical protein
VSWNCAINLYLPAANLGTALLATSKVVEPSSTAPCEVLLPNGECLSLPFGGLDDRPQHQVIVGSEPVRLDLVLKVPVDAAIDEWWDEEPYLENGCRYAGIGMINLYLSVGARYAEMSFHSLSESVSNVLYESRAIHDRLLRVLQQAGGLAAAIVPDDGPVRVLSDPSVELKIDWERVKNGGDPDPERMAEQVIRQSGGDPNAR